MNLFESKCGCYILCFYILIKDDCYGSYNCLFLLIDLENINLSFGWRNLAFTMKIWNKNCYFAMDVKHKANIEISSSTNLPLARIIILKIAINHNKSSYLY